MHWWRGWFKYTKRFCELIVEERKTILYKKLIYVSITDGVREKRVVNGLHKMLTLKLVLINMLIYTNKGKYSTDRIAGKRVEVPC